MIFRQKLSNEQLVDLIVDFTARARENILSPETEERIFDPPLVGFASGTDPLFLEFRNHIGSFSLTPLDVFTGTLPGSTARQEELAVICWIIPATDRTRKEQAAQEKYPSKRWARTRMLGEEFNNALRRHVVDELAGRGIEAVAPLLSPLWSRSDRGPYAPCSNWSERHAAYAAGLGTFGLCDGLITPAGKAVRVGSVVARLDIRPSRRPYDDHHAYCLHYSHDTCRECMKRCPVQAITEAGHDKRRCMQYTEKAMKRYIEERYGFTTYACGLCQAGVACTGGIPDGNAYAFKKKKEE